MKNVAIYIITLCSLNSLLWAQQDPLLSQKPTFSHQYTFENWDYYKFIDTSFSDLQNYHRWNNSLSDIFGSIELTNIGGAIQPLKAPESGDIWSYYNQGAYSKYFLSQDEIPYYYVRSALTEAQYFMGLSRGHVFKIHHTQNVNKYLNFYVSYKRLNSLGFFNNNTNSQGSFVAGANYNNPKSGYKANGYILTERLITGEFGGLIDDVEEEVVDPTILLVSLENDQNTDANRQIYFNNSVRLGRFLSKKDTSGTTESASVRIGGSFKYKRMYSLYNGFSSDYYNNYFTQQPGNEYVDSVANEEYNTRGYLETTVGNKYKFDLKGGISHLIVNYGSSNFRFQNSNLGVFSEAAVNLSDRLSLKGKFDYIFTGAFSQNIDMKVNAKLQIFKWLKAFGGYSFVNRNADMFDLYYVSNNFIWNNDFEKERFLEFNYGVSWLKGNSLTLTQKSLFNYVYFDADASPAQADETVNIFEAKLTQNFTFWNFLHLDNDVIWQNVSSNSAVLPLPQFVTRNAAYLEFRVFKKSLHTLLGGEMNYFSEYNAPSFNPATSRFYVANELIVGNYPYFDLFANFKIRKAQVFIKYQHLNQGFFGSYYGAAGYPLPNQMIRAGIIWRFFN